ncbi:hypothetical protein MMC13_005876 [Lambiella insularis]|nr:hypothetical protein [Lambiella insularis]
MSRCSKIFLARTQASKPLVIAPLIANPTVRIPQERRPDLPGTCRVQFSPHIPDTPRSPTSSAYPDHVVDQWGPLGTTLNAFYCGQFVSSLLYLSNQFYPLKIFDFLNLTLLVVVLFCLVPQKRDPSTEDIPLRAPSHFRTYPYSHTRYPDYFPPSAPDTSPIVPDAAQTCLRKQHSPDTQSSHTTAHASRYLVPKAASAYLSRFHSAATGSSRLGNRATRYKADYYDGSDDDYSKCCLFPNLNPCDLEAAEMIATSLDLSSPDGFVLTPVSQDSSNAVSNPDTSYGNGFYGVGYTDTNDSGSNFSRLYCDFPSVSNLFADNSAASDGPTSDDIGYDDSDSSYYPSSDEFSSLSRSSGCSGHMSRFHPGSGIYTPDGTSSLTRSPSSASSASNPYEFDDSDSDSDDGGILLEAKHTLRDTAFPELQPVLDGGAGSRSLAGNPGTGSIDDWVCEVQEALRDVQTWTKSRRQV